jgi:hypothetical protein
VNVAHAVLVAGILLLASLGGPALAHAEPYSVWDEGPLGVGHLVGSTPQGATFDGKPLLVSEGRLATKAGWPLIVVEPQRGFTAAEVAGLRDFVASGGIALLAGSSPSLAELLERLDAGITLGGALYSPGFHARAAFPLASGLGGDWVLTRPRAVIGGQPLLTTGLAWSDLNGDGQPQLGEPVAAFAVAATQPLGQGQLVVVGSPSPMVRDGWDAGPGPALLASVLPAGAPGVVVDESHRLALDPLGIAGAMTGDASGWAVPIGLGVVVAIWVLRPRVRRKDEGTPPPPGARMVVEAAAEVGP